MKLKYIILCLLVLFFVHDTFAQLPSCYYSPAEIDTFVLELQSKYPQLVKVDTIGYSQVENRPIYAVKISDHPEIDENEPEILIIGQCHAEEVLGLEFAIRFMEQLMEKYTTGMHTRIWVNELQIYVVPTMNPDGLGIVHSGLDNTWRKNLRDNDNDGELDITAGIGYDFDGVDANRNYDMFWDHGDSLGHGDYDYYRGSAPFSESENIAIRDFAEKHRFTWSIAFHSARTGTPEIIYYPWKYLYKENADYDIYSDLGINLSNHILKENHIDHYELNCVGSRKGNAHSWFYFKQGSYQFLMEIGTHNLQPDSLIVEDTFDRVNEGVGYLLDRVLGYNESGSMIKGQILDAVTHNPLQARIEFPGRDERMNWPWTSHPETGTFQKLLLPGTYKMRISCFGYETQVIENIVTNIGGPTVRNVLLNPLSTKNTTFNLQDQNGNFIEGQIRIFDSWGGMQFLNSGESIILPETKYFVSCESENYVIWCDSVDISEQSNFSMRLPFGNIIFEDDFEAGCENWVSSTNSDWDVTDEFHFEQGKVVNDFPKNFYPDRLEYWLKPLQIFDVSQFSSAHLEFKHQYTIEKGWDSAWVQVKYDDEMWRNLSQVYTGEIREWEKIILPLQVNQRDSLQFRFFMKTDSCLIDRGWFIDDVKVVASEFLTSVEPNQRMVANDFHLYQNFPNPFNSTTNFQYQIPNRCKVKIGIFNLAGQEVKNLDIGEKPSGKYKISWESGNQPSGIYFYQLIIDDQRMINKKMILLK